MGNNLTRQEQIEKESCNFRKVKQGKRTIYKSDKLIELKFSPQDVIVQEKVVDFSDENFPRLTNEKSSFSISLKKFSKHHNKEYIEQLDNILNFYIKIIGKSCKVEKTHFAENSININSFDLLESFNNIDFKKNNLIVFKFRVEVKFGGHYQSMELILNSIYQEQDEVLRPKIEEKTVNPQILEINSSEDLFLPSAPTEDLILPDVPTNISDIPVVIAEMV